MKKKKIFISGPMSGIKDYNIPSFDMWEMMLKELGYTVINPANIARKYKISEVLSKKKVFNKMVEEELEALRGCDYILLLKGWHLSKGSKKELWVALDNGLEIKIPEEIDYEYYKKRSSNSR